MKRGHDISLISLLAAVAMLVAVSNPANAIGNFVKVSLPKGVSIELPKNWVILSNNQRITLDSFVESGLDLSGLEYLKSEFPFAANYYNDRGNTVGILNIRYYPQLGLTQEEAHNLTTQDVQELDSSLKENTLKSAKAFGMSVSSWSGTKKIFINGIAAFISEYRRASLKESGEFRVRLVRVLAGDRSFTLTVSYLDAASTLLQPITDRIIQSLQLSNIVISRSSDASSSKQEFSRGSSANPDEAQRQNRRQRF